MELTLEGERYMADYDTFHRTVRGYLHVMKEIPCEDYSDSYSEESGRFHIAAVADGHGDSSCMRSATGSRAAVEIARECLKEFAHHVIGDHGVESSRSLCEELAMAKYRERVLKQLTNTIISRWFSFVKEDISENPLSEDELGMAGEYEETYRRGERLEHVYGTTLLAALMLPEYLILIQQGDGHCDVFYEDGVEQPIPWDDRCFENMTTSMCDEDVVTGIRSCVIELKGRNVIACYLGSDGVEDSFRNMEGTHMFYRGLTCSLIEMGQARFGDYLKEMLPDFSRQGSGDDVSISGIVDMEKIGSKVPRFKREIRKYELNEALERCRNRQISMDRKHGILYRRKEEARKVLKMKQDSCQAGQQELNSIMEDYRNTAAQADKAAEELPQFGKCCDQIDTVINSSGSILEEGIKEIRDFFRYLAEVAPEARQALSDMIQGNRNQKQDHCRKLCAKKQLLHDKAVGQKEKIRLFAAEEIEAEEQYQNALKEFTEYDQEYQKIQEEMDRINREIVSLS